MKARTMRHPRCRRPLLWPLLPVYAGALAAKRWLMALGVLRQRRLSTPTISVGSLSAGGAGKTPVVRMLAGLLAEEGFAVTVLSRGYGRSSNVVERVEAAGDAARFGDEPLLLARQCGAAVYVGADRYAAGLQAEQDGLRDDLAADAVASSAPSSARGKMVFLLDDAFQHRRLGRDLDIVLLTRQDVDDCLLPAGNLREPLAALRRADAVVLREEDAALAAVVAEICRSRPMPAIWMVRRHLALAQGISLPSRAVAFAGIARPESFAAMLAEAGCVPVATAAFRDHHAYTMADMTRLLQLAAKNGADGFVTTEKDAVKLTVEMRERLVAAGQLVVPELQVELIDREAALEEMRRVLRHVEGRIQAGAFGSLPLQGA